MGNKTTQSSVEQPSNRHGLITHVSQKGGGNNERLSARGDGWKRGGDGVAAFATRVNECVCVHAGASFTLCVCVLQSTEIFFKQSRLCNIEYMKNVEYSHATHTGALLMVCMRVCVCVWTCVASRDA